MIHRMTAKVLQFAPKSCKIVLSAKKFFADTERPALSEKDRAGLVFKMVSHNGIGGSHPPQET